jgi:HEPN domain-containing protein
MNKEKKEILIQTAKEYFNFAEEGLKKGNYNSCVVLYFKSLVALIDLYILRETGNTPSSHTERFRIVQKNFKEIYNILDKDFPFYQESYIQKMSKELAGVIKEDAKIMAEKNKIKL